MAWLSGAATRADPGYQIELALDLMPRTRIGLYFTYPIGQQVMGVLPAMGDPQRDIR